MKNIFTYYLILILGLNNYLFGQMVPYEKPSLIQNAHNKDIPTHSISLEDINQTLNIDIINNGSLHQVNNNTHLFYSLNLSENNIYDLSFNYKNIPTGTKLFIIEENKFLGPLLLSGRDNLVQRVFTQIQNNFSKISEIDETVEVDKKLLKEMSESYDIVGQLIEKVELKAALQESMRYVSKVNGYLNETEPWKVIKEDEKRAGRILYTALEAIDSCANLLYPFMPSTSDLVRSAIPRETKNLWGLNKIKTGVELKEIGLLFNKFD